MSKCNLAYPNDGIIVNVASIAGIEGQKGQVIYLLPALHTAHCTLHTAHCTLHAYSSGFDCDVGCHLLSMH